MENISLHIEAMIFSSDQAVRIKDIIDSLKKIDEEAEFTEEEILSSIAEITSKYTSSNYAFELVESGGGYQFLTKSDYHKTVSVFLNQKAKKKLSSAALETLSIIAYKQPITKAEMEQIRGVNCDYTVQKLLEKDLVEIKGKKDAPGRPLLYAVSQTFLDYFGINSTNDLPKLKDIEPQDTDNTIGENAESVESIADIDLSDLQE